MRRWLRKDLLQIYNGTQDAEGLALAGLGVFRMVSLEASGVASEVEVLDPRYRLFGTNGYGLKPLPYLKPAHCTHAYALRSVVYHKRVKIADKVLVWRSGDACRSVAERPAAYSLATGFCQRLSVQRSSSASERELSLWWSGRLPRTHRLFARSLKPRMEMIGGPAIGRHTNE